MLTELHSDGMIDDASYHAKVAALAGAKAPAKVEAADPAVKQADRATKTLCGAEAKGKRGKRMHEMNCNKCKAKRGEDTT